MKKFLIGLGLVFSFSYVHANMNPVGLNQVNAYVSQGVYQASATVSLTPVSPNNVAISSFPGILHTVIVSSISTSADCTISIYNAKLTTAVASGATLLVSPINCSSLHGVYTYDVYASSGIYPVISGSVAPAVTYTFRVK